MGIDLIIGMTAIVLVVTIITVSCYRYYTSESKRALVNFNEKYQNLESDMRRKDSDYANNLRNKEEECKRMAGIIDSLMEKQQKYNIDASIQNKS